MMRTHEFHCICLHKFERQKLVSSFLSFFVKKKFEQKTHPHANWHDDVNYFSAKKEPAEREKERGIKRPKKKEEKEEDRLVPLNTH